MNTIKFNEFECTVLSFNKNTYFNEGEMSGAILCDIETLDMNGLQDLGSTVITSITIYHDEEIIYNVDHIHATLNSISEYLTDNKIHIQVNFVLSQPKDNE